MQKIAFTLLDAHGRKSLTASKRTRFLAAVRTDPRPTVQTFAATLAHTGCRISEALALRALDVDLEASGLRIRTLRRRREHWRAVPIPEPLTRELDLVHRLRRAQSSPRGRTARLWPVSCATATRHITALMQHADTEGPQACPKGLRHAYGVAAVAAGVPLSTVAAVLGHADLATTAVCTTAFGADARELVARMWS